MNILTLLTCQTFSKQDFFEKHLINLMKVMFPITPHLSSECLETLKCKSHEWPSVDKKVKDDEQTGCAN